MGVPGTRGCPVRCWRSTTPCARAARGLGRSLPMHLRGWLQPSDPTANYDQAARNLVVLSRMGFVNDAQTTKEKSPCQVMSEQLPSGSLALVYHTLWQDALATPRWPSRALCAKQIQKKQHPISSGQATFWNSTPHKPNGLSLPASVIPCCDFTISHDCPPASCYCLLRCYLYKTFAYYFRGHFHWTPDSPCVCT